MSEEEAEDSEKEDARPVHMQGRVREQRRRGGGDHGSGTSSSSNGNSNSSSSNSAEFDELVQRGLTENIVRVMKLYKNKSYEVQKAGVVLLFRLLWFPEQDCIHSNTNSNDNNNNSAHRPRRSTLTSMRPGKGGLQRTRSGTWIRSRVFYDEYDESDMLEREQVKARRVNTEVYRCIQDEGGVTDLLRQIEEFPEYFNTHIRIRAEVMRAWFTVKSRKQTPFHGSAAETNWRDSSPEPTLPPQQPHSRSRSRSHSRHSSSGASGSGGGSGGGGGGGGGGVDGARGLRRRSVNSSSDEETERYRWRVGGKLHRAPFISAPHHQPPRTNKDLCYGLCLVS
eukprot:TRINITY_DN7580_c0_g1_i1.p1 TRINITY_DN7580_c0_g1~~TRINITY_DN7580_c0_g1_i1.p1  ORF type:complete len:338 (-),score=82.05 TRINITY_DN7580_c0_g1_i1:51-1064(-)